MRILLMGSPGAGKGTQAVRLAESLRVPHISTGDIFRANVAAQTDLGRAAQKYMNDGAYVPDELTNALVFDRLSQVDAADGFILDGYPRTTEQVVQLETFLSAALLRIDVVPCLDVPRPELVTRLTKRGAQGGRTDDSRAVVERRLDLYDHETRPLLDMFRARGTLRTVDGTGVLEDVTERLQRVVHAARPNEPHLARM